MTEPGEGGPPVASARLFEFPAALRPRTNLPTSIARVVGREAVVDRLLRQVAHARLITLVGPGGIGKTTVALAVAERAIDDFPDGVWFVDVAPLRDGTLVPQVVAGATGLTVHSADILPALCRALRHGRTLLVIDNCEHLAAPVAACVSLLLREAPGLRVLATSRCALQVDGELEHRLEGLASPPPSTGLTAALALTFPAVALFVDRATDRSATFALADDDAAVVADICRSLDGIALAIELAAMRVDVFDLKELHRQLNGRLNVLAGRRAGLERHRTLAATLDWSYSLLPDAEARLLRAVSVFTGGFHCAGAAAVADLPVPLTARLLAELAAKSLLAPEVDAHGFVNGEGAGDPTRGASYRLLDTTRVYGAEKLAQAGEERPARMRHAQYVCATLERATAEWGRQLSRDWGHIYGRYLDDLRAALAWADAETAHHDLMVKLTSAGTLLWNHFSLTDESRVRLTQGIARLDASRGRAPGTWSAETERAHQRTEMHLQFALAGAIMYTRGMTSEARRVVRRALELSERLGDTDFRLRCLRLTATIELFAGENIAAMRTLETFLSIAGAEDPSALAEGETHLGVGETFVGRLASARRRMERVCAQRPLDLTEAGIARFQYSNSVNMLVVLCHAQWLTGQPDAAARTAEKILAFGRQSTHELSLSIGLAWNALTYLWLGQDEDCRRHAAMLDDLVARHGIVTWRPIATFCRGAVAARQPDGRAQGIAAMRQAVAEFRQIGHLSRLPFYLAVLAEALGADGRFDDAEATLHQAHALAVGQHDQWCLPEIHRIHAGLASAQGHTRVAEAFLHRAIERAAAIGALSWELRASHDLAQAWRAQGRRLEAQRLLRAVLDRFDEGFGTRDLVAAASLLALLQAEIQTGSQPGSQPGSQSGSQSGDQTGSQDGGGRA
ncbi:MAG: ATPase [Rubrivivax sp.]|nr:MAG: ATPase [Rubrivivax sp.]